MGRVKFHFADTIEDGERTIDGYVATQCKRCKQWLDTPEDAEGCRDLNCPVIREWYRPDD